MGVHLMSTEVHQPEGQMGMKYTTCYGVPRIGDIVGLRV